MRTLILFIFALFYTILQAQELSRKASLGAQIEHTEQGLELKRVIGSTAKALQMQEKDILLAINNQKIQQVNQVTTVLKSYKAGDKAEILIQRGQKQLLLKGKFEGRPLEKSDFSDVIYSQAPFKGGQLRVIINKPQMEGKLPAMLFIPGYTCSSIDNLSEDHPYKRFIDAYIKAGFVTLRIEKSGLGDSDQTPPCETCDLYDEIENFEVGLKKLKSLPYVDTTQIIVIGHSMGGIIAPAIAAKNQVAGIIVYGTTAKSWFEYQLEMYRVQNLLAGMEPLAYEQSVRDQYELNYRFFIKQEPLSVMANSAKNDSILRQHWMYDGQDQIYGRNAQYWRQIQLVNHLENWKNTHAKVLVQFGESDFQAFSKADHEQIVRTVNHYRPNHATLMVYPETDHYYAKSGNMQDAYNKFINQQYDQLFKAFNFDVTTQAVNWSKTIALSSTKVEPKSRQWQKLPTDAYPGKQDDIYFVNQQTGWYINGTGSLYQTRDGGNSWLKIYEKKGSFFRTIAFIDENIGFLGTVGTGYFPNVTDTIPLYKTTDGGKTWHSVAYKGPYVKGLCAIDIVKEPYINHGKLDFKYHIYAVGRVGSPANMLVSNDGGNTFYAKSLKKYAHMLFDIHMFDKNTGIVCAASSPDIATSNALILSTTDGGKTWRKVFQSKRPFETTWKASFPSKNIGYVTIQSYNPDTTVSQQRIAKTTDGGKTWTELDLVQDAYARQFGIGFITENHGFVGTLNNGFETQDGGKTWRKVTLGRACNKIRFYTNEQNESYGFAIGVDVYKW